LGSLGSNSSLIREFSNFSLCFSILISSAHAGAKALFKAGAAFWPVAFLLTQQRRKTLLLQAEAVEIPPPLDYYRGPDSATGLSGGK
jgi:hypothetical protein